MWATPNRARLRGEVWALRIVGRMRIHCGIEKCDVASVPMGENAGRTGDWLRKELMARGYKIRGGQSQFARDAGVHMSIINRVLNKGAGVENDVLRRIGKALGYNFGEMLILSGEARRDELPVRSPEELEDAPPPPPPEPDTNPFKERHERQIWEWEDLSEDVRRHVIIALRTAVQMESGSKP